MCDNAHSIKSADLTKSVRFGSAVDFYWFVSLAGETNSHISNEQRDGATDTNEILL